MGKIINTLRYGKTKTKTFVISVFVLMTVAIVLGIIGINGMNIIMLGISMVLFIICILMVFKLEGTRRDVDPDNETGDGKRERAAEKVAGSYRGAADESTKSSQKAADEGTGSSITTADESARDWRRTADDSRKSGFDDSERRKAAIEELKKALNKKTIGPKTKRTMIEQKLLLEIIKANRRSAVLDKKAYRKRMKAAVKRRRKILDALKRDGEAGYSERTSGDVPVKRNQSRDGEAPKRNQSRDDKTLKRNQSRDDETQKRNLIGVADSESEEINRGDEPATGRRNREDERRSTRGVDGKTDYKTYTKNEVKKLRKIYKFPKNACHIIIDSCKSLAVDHAPALFWEKKGRIYLLIFEESARCETLPMANISVSYKKNVREDEIIKYNSMREMGVYKEFEDMMPNFSVVGGTEFFKNLYVLGKDLEITPRSLKCLLTQFNFGIRIFDSLGIKGDHSKYFKKAYEQRIMWTDGVISQNQYQNNIRDILQSMVDDDTIIRYDFMDDLAKMVHHRLITDEYAEYYKNKRL